MKILAIVAGLFLTVQARAQIETAPPKGTYAEMFRMYALQNPVFYGVFDSTNSYFCCHFDSFSASPFDPTAIIAGGKIWHKGQTTRFKAYISVDTLYQITLPELIKDPGLAATEEDELPDPHWAFELDMMKVPGTALWQIEGEMQMLEDTSDKYAGAFSGIYNLVFAYRNKNQYIKPLPAPTDMQKEPGFFSTGYWRSPDYPEFGSIPFCFNASSPVANDEGQFTLQDLRLLHDGFTSFSNIAIFENDCLKPPPNWYQ